MALCYGSWERQLETEPFGTQKIDLLQKSSKELQVQGVETRQQGQSHAESSPSVSIFPSFSDLYVRLVFMQLW